MFPEVRLKQFIEMRGADAGPWRRICALPAFWVGLLYDSASLDECVDLIKGWSAEEVIELRNKVPREGLEAKLQNRKVIDIARDLLKISRKGLNKRSRLDSWSQDETQYLSTLEQIVDSGITPAENKLAAFRERWDFNVNSAFEEYAY